MCAPSFKTATVSSPCLGRTVFFLHSVQFRSRLGIPSLETEAQDFAQQQASEISTVFELCGKRKDSVQCACALGTCSAPQESSKDSFLQAVDQYPGHELPGGRLMLSPHLQWLASSAPDGRVILRSLSDMVRLILSCICKNLQNSALAHHRNKASVCLVVAGKYLDSNCA